MTKTITPLDIVAALKQAVHTAGEDTHRQCRYVAYAANPVISIDRDEAEGSVDPYNTGKPVEPHCIVGVVLHSFGVSLDELTKFEETSVKGLSKQSNGFSEFEFVTHDRFDIDNDGWGILEVAQRAQDNGDDWGEAVYSATRWALNRGVIAKGEAY